MQHEEEKMNIKDSMEMELKGEMENSVMKIITHEEKLLRRRRKENVIVFDTKLNGIYQIRKKNLGKS